MAKKNKTSAKAVKPASKMQEKGVVSTAPAVVATKTAGSKNPAMKYHQDGSCTVSHAEYVVDVTGIDGPPGLIFQDVNPQRSAVFTWLSAIATRYEMYRFKRLKFEYRPSCGTSTSGWVILGFDFDSLDPVPSKVEMLAWKYSSKSAPWQSTSVDVSNDSRVATFRYCNSTTVTGSDPRLNNLGKLVCLALAPEADPSSYFGELYVTYEIEFRQPAYKVPATLYGTFGSPVPWANPGTPNQFVAAANVTGNLDYIATPDGSGFVLYDVGKFIVDVFANATAGITANTTVTALTPAASPSSDFTLSLLNNVLSATEAMASYYLDVRTPPVQLNFSQSTGTALSSVIRLATGIAP